MNANLYEPDWNEFGFYSGYDDPEEDREIDLGYLEEDSLEYDPDGEYEYDDDFSSIWHYEE